MDVAVEDMRSEYQNYEDYTQSSNSLFHFMQDFSYLRTSLLGKALVPRYCREDVSYLGIQNEGVRFDEISVLQKCFCDIPLHNIMKKFSLQGRGEKFETLTEYERGALSRNNSHTDYYGKFGIAFSKKWGEDHGLTPVYYVNSGAEVIRQFRNNINGLLEQETVSEEAFEMIVHQLAFIKPIRGVMKRNVSISGNRDMEVEFIKNFADECEWRYVPSIGNLHHLNMEPVVANPNMMPLLGETNRSLQEKRYQSLWLKFDYDDIRYIIVPNKLARMDLTKLLMELPPQNFHTDADIEVQRYIMASKIIVLDEVEKDW